MSAPNHNRAASSPQPAAWQRVRISATFSRLWLAQTLRQLGWALIHFTLPVLAAVTVGATATQMGWLVLWSELPVVLASLPVGAWLDRVDPRTFLGWSLAVDALLLLGLAALVAALDTTMLTLYAAAGVLGTLKLSIELNFSSYLPRLVSQDQLAAANSRLNATGTLIQIAGPIVGGWLTSIAAALAIAAAALPNLLALLPISRLSPQAQRTAANAANADEQPFAAQIRAGFRILFEHRILRPVIVSSCAGAFAIGIYTALLPLALLRALALPIGVYSILLAIGGIGGVAGALATPWLSSAIGIGRCMILGNLLSAMAIGLTTMAVITQAAPYAVGGVALLGIGAALYSVSQISVRQSVTPMAFMGRANATRRFVVFGFLPVGAVAGAAIADATSLGAGLGISALTMLLAALIVLASDLRHRDLALVPNRDG